MDAVRGRGRSEIRPRLLQHPANYRLPTVEWLLPAGRIMGHSSRVRRASFLQWCKKLTLRVKKARFRPPPVATLAFR